MTTHPHDDMPSILDGRLVRLIDGEASAEEAQALRELMADSSDARQRHAQLQRVSELLSEELSQEMAPALPELALSQRVRPKPGTRFGSVPKRWRAAAAVAVLMAAGLAVQPVRAFIATGATRVLELISTQEPPPVPVEPAPVAEGPSSVRFVPGGSRFVLSVASPQTAGVLRITAVDGQEVAASVVEGTGVSLLVLSSELRIDNGAGTAAEYHVQIPRTLVRVEVRVDGAVVTTIDPSSAPGEWQVGLGR